MRPRLAFVGAGAVGGYVGGHLHRLGCDVTLIDPWPEHVEAIRARGLELTGVTEAERAVVEVPTMHLTEVQALSRQRPVDVAFVSVKSYDTEWATHLIAPYLSETGYVVSLQNCINEERIAAIVGWGRTVGMIAATISVDLHEAGRIRRTVPLGRGSRDVFRVGEVHGRITPRVRALGEMVEGIDSVKVTSNLWGERWSKLCVNAMRNGISAATGLSGNDCDRDEALRRFSIRVGSEGVRIGQALGYALERIQNIEPERLALAGEGDAAALEEAEAVLLAVTNSGARSDLQRPSMAQDMLKGRRTEIDHINGFIVREGSKAGRAAPANAALTDAVRQVERGEAPARRETVADLRPGA
ncbi:2-dehydropantoate 2-reductase [Craurococcus roseus]|uniref:2-dehydropantoate 2-reductase n=1 Tax=Craurococcus roseus TaxID=77585 RepID=A0ABP3PZC3_9PROT